jgi:ribosomal protein S18 acetylase RimI-like enzyme
MSKPTPQIMPLAGERLEIEVSRATVEDVATIRDLLIQHFGYIYVPLLGNSEGVASEILASILKENGGRHPLGYHSFHVARHKDRRHETAGLLRMKTKSTAEWYGALISVMSVIKLLLRHLGPGGTFRALRTWRVIRGVTPEVETDELNIVYIAVTDSALKQRVGKQLLEYAKTSAAREGKRYISLSVRARNVNAQGFFLSQGFSVEETVTDTPADNFLKQGPSIRMTTEVPPLAKTA